ncbi:MAG: acyltransferase family protein [Terriglobales bacterium]
MKGKAVRGIRWLLSKYEIDNSPNRYVPMEGVRGFAALLVFLAHFTYLFNEYAWPDSLSLRISGFFGTIGHVGLDLFFIVSGALIYGILLGRATPYFKFLHRRVERIYPTFLVMLLVYLVLSAIFPTQNKLSGPLALQLIYVMKNVLLMPGIFDIAPVITVSWSLSYEFAFYLTVPLLIALFRFGKFNRTLRVLALVVIFVALLMTQRPRLATFAAGALLTEVFATGVKHRLHRRGEIIAMALFVAMFAAVFRLYGGVSYHGTLGVPLAFKASTVVLVCLLSCIFVTYCFEYRGWSHAAFSWSPLRYLGNISYSFYLIHGLTLKGLELVIPRVLKPEPHSALVYWGLCAFCFAASWIAATALFLIIERPFSIAPQQWRVAQRAAGKPQPAPAMMAERRSAIAVHQTTRVPHF